MKLMIFITLLFVSVIAFSQAPVTAPVSTTTTVTVPSTSSSLFSPAIIAGIVSIVLCLNIALSAAQQIFTQLGKQEPSAMTSVSSMIAKVATYLGSNPQL